MRRELPEPRPSCSWLGNVGPYAGGGMIAPTQQQPAEPRPQHQPAEHQAAKQQSASQQAAEQQPDVGNQRASTGRQLRPSDAMSVSAAFPRHSSRFANGLRPPLGWGFWV